MAKAVAVIPARGGSKRLPGKNAKLFFGKPMIQYSIDAAKKSGLFERVIVTTDSPEIAEISKKLGAEVPFIRPADLADDITPISEAHAHALKWLEENDPVKYDYSCMIFATAPFIQVEHLKQCFDVLKTRGVTSVLPVATFDYPILRALSIEHEGRVEMMWPEHEFSRSNDLPEAYHDVGQFYWINNTKFFPAKRLLIPDAIGVPIPRHLVQDVDTAEDWARAEQIYKAIFL